MDIGAIQRDGTAIGAIQRRAEADVLMGQVMMDAGSIFWMCLILAQLMM